VASAGSWKIMTEFFQNIAASGAGFLLGYVLLLGIRAALHSIASRNNRRSIAAWQRHTR